MKACGITDVGLQRHENQDTFAVERGAADGQLIAVVCDGMGGENCGQIASSLAVRAFLDELHAVLRADMTTEQLREAVSFCVSKANAAVKRHAQEHTECHGMGTTLVSAVTNGSGAVICNVGDSRIYRLRGGRMEQLTQDHSLVGELVRAGILTAEEARTHPRRNIITRALGTEGDNTPDLLAADLQPGDRFLLCTDGLTGMVRDEDIERTLLDSKTIDQAANRLVEMALDAGGSDNVTLILCTGEEGKPWKQD